MAEVTERVRYDRGEQSVADPDLARYNNDKVPERWKNLFTNEEWFMHDIVVKSTYGFLAIAIVAHILVYLWQPWLP